MSSTFINQNFRKLDIFIVYLLVTNWKDYLPWHVLLQDSHGPFQLHTKRDSTFRTYVYSILGGNNSPTDKT